MEDTNIPQWAIEDRRKQELIKNNIERMPAEVREQFEKDKEHFANLMQKEMSVFLTLHTGKEPEELTEEEQAFYEAHEQFLIKLETEDIYTWKK